MASPITADVYNLTVDDDTITVDADVPGIPANWPCASLPTTPPSVADREAAPTADDLLPQILALTPRGAAWGTDEAGNGSGASPVQRSFWRGIAAWVADHLGRDFEAASQTFPSGVSYSLLDWEAELGLPGRCGSGQGGLSTRVAAVRTRFAAHGGQSPAYLTCLARSAGYDVTIEEPTQFFVDVSECVGGDPIETWFYADDGDGCLLDSFDVVEAYAVADEAACDDTPVESYVLPALGDGDPLEALVLAPAEDASGEEVAGGWIEEGADCDDAVCDDTAIDSFHDDSNGTVWKFWVVHVGLLGETWFRIDEGEVSADPIEGFVPAADLECLLQGLSPPSTRLVFDYAAAA